MPARLTWFETMRGRVCSPPHMRSGGSNSAWSLYIQGYRSGFQPLFLRLDLFLGRCPRLIWSAPSALLVGMKTRIRTFSGGPRARPIPAWGNAPGSDGIGRLRGLRARFILTATQSGGLPAPLSICSPRCDPFEMYELQPAVRKAAAHVNGCPDPSCGTGGLGAVWWRFGLARQSRAGRAEWTRC